MIDDKNSDERDHSSKNVRYNIEKESDKRNQIDRNEDNKFDKR